MMLDIIKAARIRAAVEKVDALDILINNAGISLPNDLSDRAALELLAVNFFGTYDVTRAFVPVLARARSAIVNILSLAECRTVRSPLLDLEGRRILLLAIVARAFGLTR
jgi:NAD(P)-dependent dehydrogenase (short-subunit alcohol dehydrogenase family)